MLLGIDLVTFVFVVISFLTFVTGTLLTLAKGEKRSPWTRLRRRVKDITFRKRITRGPFRTFLKQLREQLPHPRQLGLDGS